MKIFLRILIIGAIILILIFLSIGIVRIVPKAINSLASASVSIGSLFSGKTDTNASSTLSTAGNGNGPVANGSQTSENGFIVSSSTSSTVSTSDGNSTTTSSTSTRSLRDILTPNFNKYPANNYVPTPGTDMSRYNTQTNVYRGGTNTYTSHPSAACTASGAPDLVVTVLSKGVIDRNTNQFIATNSFTTSDTVSIKFKVENRGTCASGPWSFHAQLPSSNSADVVRDVTNIASLPAGTAVTGVANFDAPTFGTPSAVFTVTESSGFDADPANNTTAVGLTVVNSGTVINNNPGTIGDGRADLTLRILQIGTLDYNNNFIPSYNNSSFRSSDRVAVKFEVINQGRTQTGAWNFQASLSGNGYPAKIYNNPQYEASIPAGAKSTYTIAYDNILPGSNTLTITVDNMNQVNEFDENNNTASVSFSAY